MNNMKSMADIASHEITVHEGAHLPAGLDADRAVLWTVERELWAPRTLRLGDGAALTAGRPHTAYRKIVDVFCSDLSQFRALVRAAVDDVLPNPDGSRPAPVVVKFEEHPNRAPITDEQREVLHELGFVPHPAPLPSVPSTRVDAAEFTRGWSKWLAGEPSRKVPYYGQTTDVTCGPVTSLMSLEGAGLNRLDSDQEKNHAIELSIWRRATNYPGCDPVSMALTVAEDIALSGQQIAPPKVILSAPGLVLIDDEPSTEEEIRLRTALQLDALRRAEATGLPVERRWFTVEEIRDIVAGGADVFLMITLKPLIDDPNAHWVLVHDVIGESLIVSDPWVEAMHGESWVDCSEMPIPLAGIDLIARWGDPVYRAIIVMPK